MEIRKLTDAEVSSRYLFIGECVDNNVALPSNNKFGVNTSMTVQDLCNSNIATLEKIGIGVERLVAEKGSSRFSHTKTELKLDGIPASKWLEFIELTIVKINWDAKEASRKDKVKILKQQLESLETPEEKKKKLQEELTALEA